VRILLLLALAGAALAQDPPKPDDKPQGPQIRYTYLNVCNPSDEEKAELQATLDRIPAKAAFAQDFEITRGRSTMQDAEPARYVRLRRELSGGGFFSNAQYSLSTDSTNTVETLVLKVREPKDLFSISLETQVSASVAAPASVLDVNTPVSRIKLERFGKSNVVLARCPAPADQSVYEPLFASASRLLSSYRTALGLRSMFRSDIHWLSPKAVAKTPAKTPPKSKASSNN